METTLSLQIVSDLHLELTGSIEKIPKTADYIALCGDIGAPKSTIYEKLLVDLSSRYIHVFVISGNHEYYNAQSSIDEIDDKIQSVCDSLPNVSYLNNKSHIIGNIRFVGTTLWSDTSADRFVVSNMMNDYSRIRKKVYIMENGVRTHRRYLVSPSDTTAMHGKAVNFIISEVMAAKKAGQKVVVLSHHLPTYKNIDVTYKDHPCNSAFATNLEYLIADPIVLWAHGHSHYSVENKINDVLVVSNPFGYPGEVTGYDASKVFEISDEITLESL